MRRSKEGFIVDSYKRDDANKSILKKEDHSQVSSLVL